METIPWVGWDQQAIPTQDLLDELSFQDITKLPYKSIWNWF